MKIKTLPHPYRKWTLFCLMVSFSVNAIADKNKDIILKGGFNISNVYGYHNYYFGPNFGFNLGVYTQKNIADRISIKLGIEYTKLGTQFDVIDNTNGFRNIRERHQFNFLMFPIIFGYSVGKKTNLEVGMQLGYFLGQRLKSRFTFSDPQKPDSVYMHIARGEWDQKTFNNGSNYHFSPIRVALHLGVNFKIKPQWSLHFAILGDATDMVRSMPSNSIFAPINQTNLVLSNFSFQSSVCYYLKKSDKAEK